MDRPFSRIRSIRASPKILKTSVRIGCGDGSQLALAEYPKYLGLDMDADRPPISIAPIFKLIRQEQRATPARTICNVAKSTA